MQASRRWFGTFISLSVLVSIVISGCSVISPLEAANPTGNSQAPVAAGNPAKACPVTEPEWVMPPDDAAVLNPPAYGHYYVNADRSIWASAWWTGQEETYLRAGEDGIKVGWFRSEGAELRITGQRLDVQAPPLEAHVPCCYPTRFQATGLFFPSEGCWEVAAQAADRKLIFTVWVAP